MGKTAVHPDLTPPFSREGIAGGCEILQPPVFQYRVTGTGEIRDGSSRLLHTLLPGAAPGVTIKWYERPYPIQ